MHVNTNLRLAIAATLHCLTGCAIGEILGMVVATALGWHDLPSIVLSVVLAFVFGYGLTMRPLLAARTPFRGAVRVALAGDTLSIVVMEIVDTAIVLAIPGAMDAGLLDPLFWGSLVVALAIALVAAVPANYWLIGRGGGHSAHGAHPHHGGGH
jgi:molybdopterin-binding protein